MQTNMQPSALPSAFLFDMDGLLLDTERMFLDVFLELTSDHGIHKADADQFFRTLVGTSSATTSQRLNDFLPSHVDITAFEATWRANHRRNVELTIPIKAHAVELLDAIDATGVPMAVVTSTHANAAHHHLGQVGLLKYFQTICAGDEVSENKPHPMLYLTAAERLGVKAEHCIAFEDSDLGTMAAARAGCRVFQVPDLRPLDKPLPDLNQTVVRDLGEAGRKIGLLDEGATTLA